MLVYQSVVKDVNMSYQQIKRPRFRIPGSQQPLGMAGRVAGHVQWSTYYSYLQALQAIYCRKNPYDLGNQELRHDPILAPVNVAMGSKLFKVVELLVMIFSLCWRYPAQWPPSGSKFLDIDNLSSIYIII